MEFNEKKAEDAVPGQKRTDRCIETKVADRDVKIAGQYQVCQALGRGATSCVYLACDTIHGGQVAIKIISKPDGSVAKESELIKRLFHPALPKIRQVWQEAGLIYVVMDYVEGRSLMQWIEESNGLICAAENPGKHRLRLNRLNQCIDWGKQLCKVLIYLHSQTPPLIYRDLKPENIILQRDGRLKLVDFGTMMEKKRFWGNDCQGTRGYAAPEQYRKYGRIDDRTDIYCLGKTLFHIWLGELPGKGTHPEFWKLSQRERRFLKILMRCTRRTKCLRFHSLKEVLSALEQL